jgi:secondary thiamine-phosphate synthase enzyme
MPVHSESLTLQTKTPREIVNITPQVKAALEKSGLREGIIAVTSLHVNSAVIVNDEEPGLLEDIDQWISRTAPAGGEYKHRGQFESNAGIHLQALLLHHQVIIPFSEGRLELGPWQWVLYVELDGLRPKKISLKLIGE